jgi:hypothetical protein
MVHKFVENKMEEEHKVTVGVEFGGKNIVVNGQTIKLQVWDTVSLYCVFGELFSTNFLRQDKSVIDH